MDNTKQYLLHL